MSNESFSIRADERFVDTLRLSEEDRRSLLAQLQREEPKSPDAELRDDNRFPYEAHGGVVMKLSHPGGSVLNYLVRPVNISRGGIGFLHGNFVHVGSGCALLLRDLAGGKVVVTGRVVWCRHVTGRVHAVGVQFRHPIEPEAFVESCLRAEPSEQEQSTELPQMAGRVLYICDSVDDRELLRFHLDNLGVTMDAVRDGLEAMEALAQQDYDLIVSSYWLPGMTGAEIAESVAADGNRTPLILLTADGSDAVRKDALNRGCAHVMTMPYTLESLTDLLRGYLSNDEADGGTILYSQHWPDLRMRPLILGFLERLGDQVDQLAELVESDPQHEIVRKMCLDLKGSAAGYGYGDISRVAGELLEVARARGSGPQLREKMSQLNKLATAARRVCKEAA